MLNMIQKILQNPKRAYEVLIFHSGKVYGHRDYKKFFVLTRSRTGSNMLIKMLNSHPEIHARSEILSRLNGRSIEGIIKKQFCKVPLAIKAVGFKIFYNQPFDDKSGLVWEELKKIEGLFVIHLKRRNLLRTIVSREIAGNTNVWYSKNGNQHVRLKDKQVLLKADDLARAFNQTREWESVFERNFQRHATIIDVFYEDLVLNPEGEFQQITNQLGLEPISPRHNSVKQNPEKLPDLIINYDALKKSFQNSEWISFFED